MVRVKTRIDRSAVSLPVLPLFELSDFNSSVSIPIQQQIDDKPWELVSTVKFSPVTSPAPGNIPPGTEPPDGTVLYDASIHSGLLNGVERDSIKVDGSTAPNGKGLKVAGTGSPSIFTNSDKTFSLVCDPGHGRFYTYVTHFDATVDLECMFTHSQSGQTCRAQLRSRYLETGSCENRFAGYDIAVDRTGYFCERLDCQDGTSKMLKAKTAYPSGTVVPATEKFFTLQATVKKEGTGVRIIGALNGKQILNILDTAPKPSMTNKALYDAQSYFGIKQDLSSGTGELRIKRLRLIQA